MITMDLRLLNPLEKQIHEIFLRQQDFAANLRITQAAQLCQCFVSKISKFVKKLGFHNYKQYMGFLAGNELVSATRINELQRFLAQKEEAHA